MQATLIGWNDDMLRAFTVYSIHLTESMRLLYKLYQKQFFCVTTSVYFGSNSAWP